MVNQGNLVTKCEGVKRSEPSQDIDAETAKRFSEQFRTLPVFEKDMSDYVYKRHCSLSTNKFLKCRWKQYKMTYEDKIFLPHQFPDKRHIHFYNGCVKYVPSQSIHLQTDFRMKLGVGPGVDCRGQMPIADDMMISRGSLSKEKNDITHRAKQKQKN